MAQNEYNHAGHDAQDTRAIQNMPTNSASLMSSEEDLMADVDEPPDLRSTPRSSALRLDGSFTASFSKMETPRCERKQSLLTNALHSNESSPVEESPNTDVPRGMSTVSTWSNNSASTAELTSDGGFTSPGTRAETPSPPLPTSAFHTMIPIFNKKPFDQPASIVQHDEENIGPLQTVPVTPAGEEGVEATLGRKRCISFACGRKDAPKPVTDAQKPKESSAKPAEEVPKRICTIKFACPSKLSADAPSKINKPRTTRAVSPAPPAYQPRGSPKVSPKHHRGSDSTVRNISPIRTRKVPAVDRTRRLSTNSDLAHCEAFRFHEFASSEEEVDEWVQESTCHRNRLTVTDTLRVENNLRQLGEEAEEEALEDEEQDDEQDVEDDEDVADADDDVSDEGFQTDDEEGFAGSDDDSDAGSDYNWWTPGYSTAATSIEHLEHIRPVGRRSISESSIGSLESNPGFMHHNDKFSKRKKSRPVNIRVPSPELPDSTDFVCGTLDEDRPLEEAYISNLERRRAAKHRITPQDIDPTFPTSDPEMDEEDEEDEFDQPASESDAHLMVHGSMDPVDDESRGRRQEGHISPRRLRSPPPAKRITHRSPPPRKLFGQSPKRMRSPAPVRLRSPPPTRRGSAILSPRRPGMTLRFAGLAERPALTMSSSLPRTPVTTHLPELHLDDEDTCQETPMRRAIDIKVGLENKRQRRRQLLYKKLHCKSTKDKRCPAGKGVERMREMGLGLAAHKGKTIGFGFGIPPTPDQKDIHVLSV